MSITRRGLIWEILNSLWIIGAFFNMAFISFFYIGSKTKNVKWKIYGAIYFLINVVALILVGILDYTNIISDILIGLWFIGYFIGLVHSFIVRKEYLIRRDYILNNGIEEAEIQKIKDDVHSEYKNYFGNSGNDTQMDSTYYSNISYREYENNNSSEIEDEFEGEYRNKAIVEGNEEILDNSKYFNYGKEENNSDLININNCSKEELLNLPGIDEEKADKIISLRNMMGGFNSVQEFIDMTRIDSSYSAIILQKATVREKTIN